MREAELSCDVEEGGVYFVLPLFRLCEQLALSRLLGDRARFALVAALVDPCATPVPGVSGRARVDFFGVAFSDWLFCIVSRLLCCWRRQEARSRGQWWMGVKSGLLPKGDLGVRFFSSVFTQSDRADTRLCAYTATVGSAYDMHDALRVLQGGVTPYTAVKSEAPLGATAQSRFESQQSQQRAWCCASTRSITSRFWRSCATV